jgi:hypothetical protein
MREDIVIRKIMNKMKKSLPTHPPITNAIIFFHSLFAKHVSTLSSVLFRGLCALRLVEPCKEKSIPSHAACFLFWIICILRLLNLQLQRQRCSRQERFKSGENIFLILKRCRLLDALFTQDRRIGSKGYFLKRLSCGVERSLT